jgi:hypothetical protein
MSFRLGDWLLLLLLLLLPSLGGVVHVAAQCSGGQAEAGRKGGEAAG